MTTSSTDSLPTIALDELISRGSLLTRLDRKYALTSADAGMAQDLVDADTTRVLQFEGVSNLCYSSTYLDTPELDTFLLAARRRRRRFERTTGRHGPGVVVTGPPSGPDLQVRHSAGRDAAATAVQQVASDPARTLLTCP